MSTPKDGGPAYPGQPYNGEGYPSNDYMAGMSLRDYFAAQALHGICATLPTENANTPADLAGCCYEFADAMIAAREANL